MERAELKKCVHGPHHVGMVLGLLLTSGFCERAMALQEDGRKPTSDGGEPEQPLTVPRPRVVVRLLESDGRPWSGPEVRFRPGENPGEWPTVPWTFVVPSDPLVASSCVAGLSWRPKRTARSEVAYQGPAGTSCFVGASGGPFDGRVRLVEVPEGAEPILVEIRAREAREHGSVSVRVKNRETELGVSGDDAHFTVELRTLRGDVPLVTDGSYWSDSPFRFRVPPATYRVVAKGYPGIEPYHGGLTRARDLGHSETEITVKPGETLEVELPLDAGGRLELTLEGEGNEDEFLLLPVHFGSSERVHAVELFLESPSGRAEAILRRRPGLYQDNLGSDWPVGETHVSECLPTGRATIVGRLQSGREVRVEVEVREAETTKAKLSF